MAVQLVTLLLLASTLFSSSSNPITCEAFSSPLSVGHHCLVKASPLSTRFDDTKKSNSILYSTADDEMTIDDEVNCDYHDIYWLDEDAAAYTASNSHNQQGQQQQQQSLGQAIGQGQTVICIPEIADFEETQELFAAGLAACEGRGPTVRGRSRFSVSDPTAFSSDVVLLCDEILLRVLDHLDNWVPSIFRTLFVPTNMEEWAAQQPLNAQGEQPTVPPPDHLADMCDGLRELYMMAELEWSEGEPAINIYEGGGYFGAHKDHLALTVLIPLTSPGDDFAGGGTGFWKGNREVDENPSGPPDLILKPQAGSALIFGGDVTHAGMPVEAGFRSVFVCSFSTRTPVSSPDRLHGMQAPPKVSPNFKGTM